MRECNWCRLKKELPQGRFAQGNWVCYTCFPNNVKLLDKAQKCCNCKRKSNEGMIQGTYFICSVCNPFFHHSKSGKKKRKQWEYEENVESSSKKEKKNKHKQKQENKLVKKTRWVVIITEISTGEL